MYFPARGFLLQVQIPPRLEIQTEQSRGVLGGESGCWCKSLPSPQCLSWEVWIFPLALVLCMDGRGRNPMAKVVFLCCFHHSKRCARRRSKLLRSEFCVMIRLQTPGKGHDFPALHFLHTQPAQGSPGGWAGPGMFLESLKIESVT